MHVCVCVCVCVCVRADMCVYHKCVGPNLVILDGGLNQVNAVKDLLWAHNIAVIGRDKSGDHTRNAAVRIIIPEYAKTNNNDETYRTVLLRPDSHVAKLIARIDDEAHRFAITYHTLLKRKNMLR